MYLFLFRLEGVANSSSSLALDINPKEEKEAPNDSEGVAGVVGVEGVDGLE